MESPNHDSLAKAVQELQRNVQSILKENIAATKLNHRNDIRTIVLLKALAGEIVLAQPTARARIYAHLDEMMLLHGNDSLTCGAIKSAIEIVTAA
jgi:hypothetical protein